MTNNGSNISLNLQNYLSSKKSSESTISGKLSNYVSIKMPFSSSSEKATDPVDSSYFGGWVASPFGQKAEKESSCSWLPSLSRKQRIVGFIALLLMGLVCFSTALCYLPVLVFKLRKFVLLFTLGSLLVLLSFSSLWGPVEHCKHLLSSERMVFTTTYIMSLSATLYCAISLNSTILTTLAGSLQALALLWYLVSYIPGGTTGLSYMSSFTGSFCKSAAGSVCS